MPFTWKDLRVNTKIVRTIVLQFLPDVGIVLLASGKVIGSRFREQDKE